MKAQKSITANAFARIIMYILNLLVPVLVGPYLARILDVGLYAQYNAALSITQWFLPFAVFGIYTYGIRQASRDRDDAEKTGHLFTKLFLFSIISTSIVLVCYMGFVAAAKANYFWLYTLLGINIAANYFAIEWINEAFENYKFILYKTMIVRFAYIVSIFVFVRKPEDILPYTAIASLVVFFNNLLGYLYIKSKVKFVRVPVKEVAALAKPLLIIMLLTNTNMLFLMLDRLFLSLFSKTEIFITYYSMPMLIMMAIMNVVSSIIFVAVPRLSNYLSRNENAAYRRLLGVSSHCFFLVAMPLFAGIAALGREIMYVYGGEKYTGAGSTLIVLGLMFVVYAVDLSLSNQVLFVSGMEKLLLRIYLIGGGTNLVLNTILLATGKLTPTLLITTTLISDMIVVFLQHSTIRREFGKGVSPLDKTAWKYILLSLCFLPISEGIRAVYKADFAPTVAFAFFIGTVAAVCAGFYLAMLIITKDRYLNQVVRKALICIKKVYNRSESPG